MSNLSKDRMFLCLFSFADGRRCRIPRCPSHPHLCAFHARKEAQAMAAHKLGRDLSSYFSGNYISACDLTAALGHLFSAVAKGQLKPKAANTLAYLSQTLLQSIHLAQHEYIHTFGTDAWRRAIRSSFAPPAPKPQPPAQPVSSATSHPQSTLTKPHQNK